MKNHDGALHRDIFTMCNRISRWLPGGPLVRARAARTADD